jgi:hypothetical protein
VPETQREKKVRVVLYVPEGIHSFIADSMERIITADGKQVKFTKSQNDAYLDFIKRGIATLEDDQEPQ